MQVWENLVRTRGSLSGLKISVVEFRILGELDARVAGAPVAITAAKQRALLALLLVHEHVVTVDRIIDALWGPVPPATAAKNVQVLVGRLRDVLEPDRGRKDPPSILVREGGGYRIDRATCRIDAVEHARLVGAARTAADEGRWQAAATLLRDAARLVRGEPLGEFAYEEWAAGTCAMLQEECLSAIELRIRAELQLGRHELLVPELEGLVATQPLRERLRELQLLALYRCGRQADALAAFRSARRVLDEELGIEPGPALRAMQRRILEQDPELDAPRVAPSRSLPAPPTPRTSLIGRERELEELELLVHGGVRHLTITGWGGVGKTRAATELATRVAGAFEEVAWVELTSITEAGLVPGALEVAFGIGGVDADPVDATAQAIGTRRLLLLLDNFEHVLGAASAVARLLALCPNLVVVATSRARLGLYGEHEYALHPFVVPGEDELANPGVSESDPLRLFIARARATGSSVELADAAPIIARICARVDGLPLGIELAAARARLLSPTEILERLDRRLELLTSGAADLPDRQRSLRAAIEWSYDLLEPAEQQLFRALGVFVGGCSVEAALAVATPPGEEIATLDRLESLVEKNLLARDTDALGEIRLTMLETIAEFAGSLLDHDPDARRYSVAHAQYFRGIAAAGDAMRWTSEHQLARARVQRDIANIRAAISRLRAGEPVLAARMVASLASYFVSAGTCDEATSLIESVMEFADSLPSGVQAELAAFAGDIMQRRGRPGEAYAHRQQSLACFELAGDRPGMAKVLVGLADGALAIEDFHEARRFLERAGDLADADRWMIASIENQKGRLALDTGDLEAARGHLGKAMHLFAAEGDEFWTNYMAMNMGCLALDAGQPEEGLRHLDDALKGFLDGGHLPMAAHTMCNQVNALIELARFDEAVNVGEEAVPLARQVGDMLILSYGLAEMSVALWEAGHPDRARAAARESLDIAVRCRRFRFAHHAAYVVAQDMEVVAPLESLRAWLCIDPDILVDDCALDVRIRKRRRAGIDALTAVLGGPTTQAERRVWEQLDVGARFVELMRPGSTRR